MISSLNRFRGLGSLRFVFRSGQSARGPLFGVKYSLNQKRDSYRLSVVVSKKIDKSAVARNKIRRRIYEIVRNSQADILRPYDIVITVYDQQISRLSHVQLKEMILDRLLEAGILSKRLK